MTATVPKQLDHTARRRVIVDALWWVVARCRFEVVSLRSDAAEAGSRPGWCSATSAPRRTAAVRAGQHERAGRRPLCRRALRTPGSPAGACGRACGLCSCNCSRSTNSDARKATRSPRCWRACQHGELVNRLPGYLTADEALILLDDHLDSLFTTLVTD